MALLDTLKKVAEQSQNANVPAAFLFGNVTATSPLTIRVDNRFDITGEAIVVMKEFRAGYYPTHRHSGFADSPTDRKSTRLNSSHMPKSRMPSSA